MMKNRHFVYGMSVFYFSINQLKIVLKTLYPQKLSLRKIDIYDRIKLNFTKLKSKNSPKCLKYVCFWKATENDGLLVKFEKMAQNQTFLKHTNLRMTIFRWLNNNIRCFEI